MYLWLILAEDLKGFNFYHFLKEIFWLCSMLESSMSFSLLLFKSACIGSKT